MQIPKTIASTFVFFYSDGKLAIGTGASSTMMFDSPTAIPATLPLFTKAVNEASCWLAWADPGAPVGAALPAKTTEPLVMLVIVIAFES